MAREARQARCFWEFCVEAVLEETVLGRPSTPSGDGVLAEHCRIALIVVKNATGSLVTRSGDASSPVPPWQL